MSKSPEEAKKYTLVHNHGLVLGGKVPDGVIYGTVVEGGIVAVAANIEDVIVVVGGLATPINDPVGPCP